MPPKRTYKKRPYTRRRRPYNGRRRKRNYRNKVVTKRGVGKTGIPDRMMLKMTYATTIRLIQLGLSFDNHLFSGNNLNDPDISGVGHQPKGYDQWAQFYNKTMVHGSKILCRFTPTDASSNGNTNIYILPTRDSTTLPGWVSIQEDKFGKASIVGPYVGMGIKYMSDYMSTKKIFGDANALEQSDYGATFGFSPVNNWYWVVGGETATGGDVTCDVAVVITYYVELYDRKDLPPS